MNVSGEWYACEEAERPTDPYVRWHYEDCLGCFVKAHALSFMFPDDSHVAWLNDRIALTSKGQRHDVD